MTGTITLHNGTTYTTLATPQGTYKLNDTVYPTITALAKAVKQLVLDNCVHDMNTHKSHRTALRQRCNKCKMLSTNPKTK